jgi:hypothetical protein
VRVGVFAAVEQLLGRGKPALHGHGSRQRPRRRKAELGEPLLHSLDGGEEAGAHPRAVDLDDDSTAVAQEEPVDRSDTFPGEEGTLEAGTELTPAEGVEHGGHAASPRRRRS